MASTNTAVASFYGDFKRRAHARLLGHVHALVGFVARDTIRARDGQRIALHLSALAEGSLRGAALLVESWIAKLPPVRNTGPPK